MNKSITSVAASHPGNVPLALLMLLGGVVAGWPGALATAAIYVPIWCAGLWCRWKETQ